MVRTVAGRLNRSGRVGLLPAAFNPPTTAHLALADTAQEAFGLGQVVFVLPESLPHKRIARPSFPQRRQWLAALAGPRPDRAAAVCEAGLVIEIVRAFRAAAGRGCEICVICGRDAAERYATWDYGMGEPFAEQLRAYRLLVAARAGAYRVPPEYAGAIATFEIADRHAEVSSSAVREAIRRGGPWQPDVPAELRASVATAYAGGGP